MLPSWRRCAALATVALILIVLSSYPSAALDNIRIASIHFDGNRDLSESDLLSQMKLRPPSWKRPFSHPTYPGKDVLAADLRAVLDRYQGAGHPFARIREALVVQRLKARVVDIRIRLDEGPRVYVSRAEVNGMPPGESKEVARAVLIAPGDLLSRDDVLVTRDRVQLVAIDRGYARALTDLEVRYTGDSADVVMNVNPGPPVRVDSVLVSGTSRCRPEMVRREITLGPGDLLVQREVDLSRDRLLETGVFQSAVLTPERVVGSENTSDLLVTVVERKPGWYDAGAGFTSNSQADFVADWGLRNLGGTGRQVDVHGVLNYSLSPSFRNGKFSLQKGTLSADYLEPWLVGTRIRGIVSPYSEWDEEQSFSERTLGFSFTLRRDLRKATWGSLILDNKWVATSQAGVVPRFTTRSLDLDYTDDQRDNPFDATFGHYWEADVKYAGGGLLGGTNEFALFTLDWQHYIDLQPDWTVALRVKGGGISPIGRGPLQAGNPDTLRLSRVPWDERFRLGGGTTVRGYAEDGIGRLTAQGAAIGGLSMFLANLEVRFPIVWIVHGGIFLDMGNIWTDPGQIKLNRLTNGFTDRQYNPFNTAYGMGVGLRFQTPVGPFRLDYGFKVGSGRAPGQGPGQLHVALGQAF